MDRTLGPITQAELLEELARDLVSLSPTFEPWVPGHRREGLEALGLLGSLERSTRQSLRALEARPAPEPEFTAPAPPAHPAPPAEPAVALPGPGPVGWPSQRLTVPPTPPAPSPEVRAEYRPALRDPQLLSALLDYRRRHAKPSPEPVVPRAPEAQVPVAQSPADLFEALEPPRIEAVPKLSSKLRRSASPSLVPLRPLPLP